MLPYTKTHFKHILDNNLVTSLAETSIPIFLLNNPAETYSSLKTNKSTIWKRSKILVFLCALIT